MRPIRVLYVENDPALLGLIGRLLARNPELEVVLATSSAAEALASPATRTADVALLDLSLGAEQVNGVDLGLALREINPEIGIVIHSQYRLDHVMERVPESQRMGWSTLAKRGDMAMLELAEVLRLTARGMSRREATTRVPGRGMLDDLTPRQRMIMGMTASGLRSTEIARRLGTSHDGIRKELSRAYRVLVPEASDSEDVRTLAIIAYLREAEAEASGLSQG